MKALFFILVLTGCSVSAQQAAPLTQGECIAEHAKCAQSCAICCETQPYVSETKQGVMFELPIQACSASDLPNDWSVEWCRTDCEDACVVCQ